MLFKFFPLLAISAWALSAQADFILESQCNHNSTLNISITSDQILIDTKSATYQFAIPSDFLPLFESNYQEDLTFRESGKILLQPLKDEFYNYTIVLMETKRPKDKSLKIVVDSKQTFNRETWGGFGPDEITPVERHEYFVYIRASTHVARAIEVITRQIPGTQKSEVIRDDLCTVTSIQSAH